MAVDLVSEFLKKEGYDLDVLNQVMRDTGVVDVEEKSPLSEAENNISTKIAEQIASGQAVRFPDGELRKLEYSEDLGATKEELSAQAAQEYLRQLRQETGFGDTFTYYAVEPLLGLAETLESQGLPISLDEEKAQLFKDAAEVASQDNPALGTLGMLGGALTTFGAGTLARVGSLGARGARALGAGRGLQGVAEGATVGGIYGGLIPELERGTDTSANVLLGMGLGGVTGGALRGIPAALERAAMQRAVRQVEAERAGTTAFAPEVRANTAAGRALQNTAQGLDQYLGVLSTRIGNISQSVLKRMRKFEFDAKKMTSELYDEVQPFVEGIRRLAPDVKNSIARGLYNGSFDSVENILRREAPDLVQEFRNVQGTLERVRQDLVSVGYKELETGLANYFPRIVTDYNGLRTMLGEAERGILDRALKDYAAKKGISVRDLNPVDQSTVIARLIKQGKITPAIGKPSSTLQRKIDYVTEDMLPFYASPEESLEIYLRNAAHNKSKATLLGKLDPDDPEAVSGLLSRLKDSGEITSDQVDALLPLLQARLIQGEMAPSKFLKNLRDFGYATTIANPLSAMIQLGDIAVSAVINGLKNTIKAVLGRKVLTIDDVGMKDTIIQNMDQPHRWLDKMFRYSGFKRIDRLGKETFINAAYNKANKMVQSDGGMQAFRNKYTQFYGDDIDQLIIDLRNGEATPLVKFHLFNELSGVQPISLLEMPERYLRHPNGRVLYALKSFTIKQFDILRRNALSKLKSNPTEATKFLLKYGALFSMANGTLQTVRDAMTGKITSGEEAIDKFEDNVMWQALGILGMHEYTSRRYFERGELMMGLMATVRPATPTLDVLYKEVSDAVSDSDTRQFDIEPITRTAPIVGPAIPLLAMWYNFMFGGFEEYLAERDKSNER